MTHDALQEHLVAMGVAAYEDLASATSQQPFPPFGALKDLSQNAMRELAGNAPRLQVNHDGSVEAKNLWILFS